ncbi:MAG TPA: thiamine pyrophosphate-binding protein [Candidatus Paceibacterota bacterium]|nr:thiamine pyrophosphate-binding protein [Candidatus Paceibacterota bacterium]HMO82754.1 thiamine pyrophosphate-binding protein [Candidatus Paceibacterota bacterium]
MQKTSQEKIYADEIVDFLVSHKITKVFDLTGGMIAFIEDAIGRHQEIECIPMHHEQAAGFAAEGYARTSGKFGVAMATSGPGATNLITAIGSCFFDSVPALFITGQVHSKNLKKKAEVRQEGFQETDIVSMVKHITKFAVQVASPEEIVPNLVKAYSIMKEGRPGPVLIDIPINFQRTKVSNKKISLNKIAKNNNRIDNKKKIKELEDLLEKSTAPLLLVGHGVRIAQAEELLAKFQKNNNLPVVSSLMGLDVFPHNKNFVGYIGTNGNRDANIIFANADLIIVLGSRLDLRQTGDPDLFNKSAKIVHVDIDEYSINYGIKSTLFFVSDLKDFLLDVEHLKTSSKAVWVKFISKIKKHFSRVELPGKSVNPNLFFNELSSIAHKNTVAVIDVGQNQQWCAQSWKVQKGQRLLFSGGMGAMGFSLPAAIGAWYTDMTTPVVVITGDGGLQINIQELETVSRNKIPLKIFVFNNKSLGMVREFQDLYLNKNTYTTVGGYGNPDFKKLSSAYNISYSLISKNVGTQRLNEILNSSVAEFVEVLVDAEAPLHPRTVYGHALDDQAPYLSVEQKELLESLKAELHTR